MMHDQLTEARSFARARAEEDFEFFVNTVLGLSWAPELCQRVQRIVALRGHSDTLFQDITSDEHGMSLAPRRQTVLDLWIFTVRGNMPVSEAPSETFSWLFAEKIERVA